MAAERREAGWLTPGEWNRKFLPHYFGRFGPADFHAHLDRDLHELHTRRGTKRSYIAPRGGAKSTWCTLAYPLRAALEGWEPYTLVLSDSSEQADELLKHIKSELEHNEDIAEVYPEAAGQGSEWAGNRIRLRNGTLIGALGTGKKVRGRRNRAERPSLIVFDDIQSNEDITSPTLRERAWSWATREVMPAGDERTNFLAVGSAIHREAVSVRLGDLAGWHGRTFPAIHSWPERMDLWEEFTRVATNPNHEDKAARARAFFQAHRAEMERGSATYWPARYDIADLMLKRAEIGEQEFDAEYQGRPGSGSAAEFPAEYFNRPGIWFDHWPDDLCFRVQSLDPSKGKDGVHGTGKRGDFQAHVLVGLDSRGDLLVEAAIVREPVPAMITRALQFATISGFGPLDSLAVEDNDSLGMLEDEFRKQLADRKRVVPVQGVRQYQNKVLRIQRLGIYFGRGRVRFRNTPGTRMLVNQLRDFPTGDHDDGPDALELAVRRLELLTNGGG